MNSLINSFEIRKDFPIFNHTIDKPLIYLDNAATSQKPNCVIDAISNFYRTSNANAHRASYSLGLKSSALFEEARSTIANFLGFNNSSSIVFTRNATEAFNMLARGIIESKCKKGDTIVTTICEHHANFVPWQQLAKKYELKLIIVGIDTNGQIDLKQWEDALKLNPKIATFTHCSNVLGVINPIEELIKIAKLYDTTIIIDGSQGVVHTKVNLSELNPDFYVFTGHKMLGPTGIGVIAGNIDALEKLPPTIFGGDMVDKVSIQETTFSKLPHRFEAGTPPIAEAIGLAEACRYLQELDRDALLIHEKEFLEIIFNGIKDIPNIQVIGPKSIKNKIGLLSLNINGIHPHDISMILDKMGICVRSGDHCAQPLMNHIGVEGSIRISAFIYNTLEEASLVVQGLKKAVKLFGV
jgi:cysteine desulfurase/selenocysteine lyase